MSTVSKEHGNVVWVGYDERIMFVCCVNGYQMYHGWITCHYLDNCRYAVTDLCNVMRPNSINWSICNCGCKFASVERWFCMMKWKGMGRIASNGVWRHLCMIKEEGLGRKWLSPLFICHENIILYSGIRGKVCVLAAIPELFIYFEI